MNNYKLFRDITKKGSKTYYNASLFFPREIRQDVFILYAFVRTADDLVDVNPPHKKAFYDYKKATEKIFAGEKIKQPLIEAFYELAQRKKFKREWWQAFFHSMEMDLYKKKYATFADLEEFMYGSADVIGLFMAAIMELPSKAYKSAQLLGKAMQLVNFIRDVQEDLELGRTYLPQEDLNKFGIQTIKQAQREQPDYLKQLLRYEIQRYYQIQKEAEKGFSFLPPYALPPIQSASQIYRWTADKIYKNPLAIFRKKVRPSWFKILKELIKNQYLFKR